MINPLDKDVFMRQMDRSEKGGDFSHNACQRFWDWTFSDKDEHVQVCAFPVPTENKDPDEMGKGTWEHVDTQDQFINFCESYSNTWRYHVYACLNTIDHVPEVGRGSSSNIDKVNHLSFDIETKRDSYSGANKEEVWWCYRYALAQAKFMNEEYDVWPMVVMSENGIHMHYKVNFDVKDDLMNGKQHKYSDYITKQSMDSYYAQKVKDKAPDHIEFGQDNVSDVPRVMKVPGTRGIKSEQGRLCGIIHCPSTPGVIESDDVELSIEYVQNQMEDKSKQVADGGECAVEVTPEDASTDVLTRVKSLCKREVTFERLFRGDTSDYDTRSDAEFAFVLKLLNHSFTPEQINQVMWASGMEKWQEETDHYRERTLRVAQENFDGQTVKDSTNGSFNFSKCSKKTKNN